MIFFSQNCFVAKMLSVFENDVQYFRSIILVPMLIENIEKSLRLLYMRTFQNKISL